MTSSIGFFPVNWISGSHKNSIIQKHFSMVTLQFCFFLPWGKSFFEIQFSMFVWQLTLSLMLLYCLHMLLSHPLHHTIVPNLTYCLLSFPDWILYYTSLLELHYSPSIFSMGLVSMYHLLTLSSPISPMSSIANTSSQSFHPLCFSTTSYLSSRATWLGELASSRLTFTVNLILSLVNLLSFPRWSGTCGFSCFLNQLVLSAGVKTNAPL